MKLSEENINKSKLHINGSTAWGRILKSKWLYIMMIPGIIYYIAFKYVPMWGILTAFQDYQPYFGLLGSPWVGLKHFQRLFSEPEFWRLLRNTSVLAVIGLVFIFPVPIILSLMLNEVKSSIYKKSIQSLIYVPHFISWVIIVGISYVFLTTEDGVVNNLIVSLGGKPVPFLLNLQWFRPLYVLEIIYKESGWGTIIFLAALSGIDVSLYESAYIDGAGRWKQMLHITLPAIRSTIVILLILNMGGFLETGFDQIWNMRNSINSDYSEVFDTYVYRISVGGGRSGGQFSYAAAIGLFKSIVGFFLVFMSDRLAKKVGEEGIL